MARGASPLRSQDQLRAYIVQTDVPNLRDGYSSEQKESKKGAGFAVRHGEVGAGILVHKSQHRC